MKRILPFILAIAVLCTMVMVPASAEVSLDTLKSAIYFNADFTTGSLEDIAGNYTYNPDISGADGNIVTDEIINKSVLTLEDEGNVIWENNTGYTFMGYDLTQGLTLEQYLYINTDPETDKINQVFFEFNMGSIHFQEYNDGLDLSSGFRCGGGTDPNYDMCNAYAMNTFPHKQWIHIVGTSDGTNNYYYLNGELVATAERNTKTADTRYGSSTAQLMMGQSIYGAMFGETTANCKIAFGRVYKACASADEVKALYAEAVSGGSEPGAPTPSATPEGPTASPTPTPEPTPEVVIPSGEAYKTTFEDTPAFKTGEKAVIPLKINGINVADGIMGFDIGITLNDKLVKTDINDEMIQEANKDNASLAALNGEGGKWSVLGRSEEGKLLLTIFDENAATVAKAENEITIYVPVEAIADAQAGDWIGYISDAEGTSGKVETIEGAGAWAMVTAPVTPVTDEPTVSETPTSSSEVSPSPDTPASPSPSPSPVNPLNPTTFDPGMASLVAVVLSSLVITKSRSKKDEE